jgi:HPt (histidine-containing phosphotransfer) domain-containing protein
VSQGPDGRTPAIDVAGGIARLMGDSALFARVLARFGKEYRGMPDAIRGALDSGDMPLALRLAHTLKGAAGLIEAVPLRRSAQALEQALRGNVDDPYARLAQLDGALDAVLHELDTALALAPAPVRAPPPLSPADCDARMRLYALLDEGNGDALDLVRDAEATLRTEMGDEMYARLAEAIDAFDFDGALALLQQRADAPAQR